MPIPLDPSLPPSLYPLAWLMGSWRGEGALHRPEQGDAGDRRVEQQLDCRALEDGTLEWVSLLHVVDSPAPLPPTSVFAREDETPAPESGAGSGERSLLMRERGIWRVGDPLPGQDLERAAAAKPGDPAGVVSYALGVELEQSGAGSGVTRWSGEVRGPRIQLAREGSDGSGGLEATRMFGYVGGRLMWLWERVDPSPDQASPAGSGAAGLVPYLSLELDRV